MTETAAPTTTPEVSFYFDAGCPWTWNTSRWLVAVADEQGFPITWRTFSLALANEGREIPERFRAMQASGQAALRIVEALRAGARGPGADAGPAGPAGRADPDEAIGRFYLELGRRWHHDEEPRSLDVVLAALAAAGLEAYAGAAEDTSWDGALRASLDEALALAGPDVGSPVLRLDDKAMFGPIISPPPVGVDARALWDAVRLLIPAEGVYEIKRGRSGGVRAGARP
jgi:2-hydroxychromene-2-carboxylate isomerase